MEGEVEEMSFGDCVRLPRLVLFHADRSATDFQYI